MSDAVTKIIEGLENHENRIANLESQETPPAVVGTPVTAVTASPPLSSSGGTTPNITHNNSGSGAGTVTNATITRDVTGHITAASSGTAPVTAISVTAPITSTGGLTPNIGLAVTTTNDGGAVAKQTSGSPVAQTGYASLANSGQNVLTIAATSSVHGVVATSQTGNALQGTSSSSGGGVLGVSSSGTGVTGTSTSGAGMVASSSSSTGLSASSSSGIGLIASSSSNYGAQIDKLNVTTSNYFAGILRGNYVSAFPGSPATGEHIIHTDLLYSEWYWDGAAWRQLTVPSKATNFTMTDTPPTGMRIYRQDLDMLCAYDGTRWRTQRNTLSLAFQPNVGANPLVLPLTATTTIVGRQSAPDADYAMYIENWVTRYSVNTTLNNTDKWTLEFFRQYDNGAAVASTSLGTYDVYQGGRAANRNYKAELTLNAAYALTDIDNLFYSATRNASGGTLAIESSVITYRLIIT